MCLSSRGLAGVLPPAGQIFEKWHLLELFFNFAIFIVPFNQGFSMGAATGGSDFGKNETSLIFDIIFGMFCDFQAGV